MIGMLAVWFGLYGLSVLALLQVQQYKIANRVVLFHIRRFRYGLFAVFTVMCVASWQLWSLVLGGRHEWASWWCTGLMVTLPILWVYDKRKKGEVEICLPERRQ